MGTFWLLLVAKVCKKKKKQTLLLCRQNVNIAKMIFITDKIVAASHQNKESFKVTHEIAVSAFGIWVWSEKE